MQAIPVHLDIPENRKPQAAYAFQMLLKPLGLTPTFTEGQTTGQIYYGPLLPTDDRIVHIPYVWPDNNLPCHCYVWIQGRRIPVVYANKHGADWVASAFFWLADVQTYLIKERDAHGRFRYESSFQAKWGEEPFPFVDYYRLAIREKLQQMGLPIEPPSWQGHPFTVCMTHDIDHLYKWTLRRWWKEKRPIKPFFQRIDGYQRGLERLLAVDRRYNLKATWFFKAGANAPEDHFYPLHSPAVQTLFQRLHQNGHEIGLHPAYFSHAHPAFFRSEAEYLRKHTPHKNTSVRQHYLRWDAHQTPNIQQLNGFVLDAGLSFVDRDGFRNGTCFPFLLYDHLNNKPTTVWEVPLCLHDTTLMQYRALTAHAALERTKTWLEITKNLNGILVGLWHNVIYDQDEYPDWATHFEESAEAFSLSGAWCTTLNDALTYFTNT